MRNNKNTHLNFIFFYFVILASGLKFLFDVKTTLNISAITFYPSQTTHGYDLYASATDKEDILFLNLVTGKLKIENEGEGCWLRKAGWNFQLFEKFNFHLESFFW